MPKRQSAFPLALWLTFHAFSPTRRHTQQLLQEFNLCALFFLLFFSHINTECIYRHTQTCTLWCDGHTHAHKAEQKTERERERDPKHQNSINPLRRSLKGFLKADFHQAEAFQVNTVCGGNGAEAFKLYALTFPLCYFLFLHLSHTASASLYHSVFCSLCILHFLSLPFWDWIRTKPAKPGNAGYV